MESWRKVWREGLAPLLIYEQMDALRTALVKDDPRLIQGCTAGPVAYPDPGQQCRAACAIGYAGWQGDGLKTVADVLVFFDRVTDALHGYWGEFTEWWDETPRDAARRSLLAEVNRSLALKSGATEEVPAPARRKVTA